MDLNLKLKILERYRSQADFASVVGMREPDISRVVHGRLKLSKDKPKEWAKALSCKPEEIFSKD